MCRGRKPEEWLFVRDERGNIINRETGFLNNHTGRATSQSHKVNYDNDGLVGWQGLFAQLEVSPSEDFNFFWCVVQIEAGSAARSNF